MRRFLLLATSLAASVACGRPPARDDLVLRIGVAGSLAPLAHDTDATATAYAQDLVYEPIFRPEGAGFTSRVLSRWQRSAGAGLRALAAEGLRFSDGSSVEIDDVVRSIEAAGLSVRVDGRWLEIQPGSARIPVATALLVTTLFKRTAAGEIGTRPFHLVSQDAGHLAVERTAPARHRIRRVELVSFSTSREALAQALKGTVNAVAGLDDRQAELLEGVPALRVTRARGPHALAIVLNARRLGDRERREISAALPLGEIAELSQGRGCSPASAATPRSLPSLGAPLEIAVMDMDAAVQRAGLAVRRDLGPRAGTMTVVGAADFASARALKDLIVGNSLVWPPAVGALVWRTDGPSNLSGYSNPAYDAAVDAGDFERAEAELRKDPPAVFLCRRERIAAIDVRVKNPTLGSWGYLDTLPEWEVSP